MKVLISGAGIAGLSLALRLHQQGLEPVVVERSPTLRSVGYMLGLSDPGYDAGEHLGIAADLTAVQYLPQRLVYLGADGRKRLALEGRALEVLIGERQINLMRGDIERILYERVRDRLPIRFGASIAAFAQSAVGVTATLDTGKSIDADLLVGADGLHSRVRALAFGPEQEFVQFLGARVAAFILDRSLVPGIAADETYSLTEVGRAAGLAAVRGGRVMAFFIYLTPRERRHDTVEAELRHAFAGAAWRVPELLDQVSKADSVYFDEVALVRAPHWSHGRIVLLGDAACAVSLIAGKGATLAMAGAVILAEALAATGDIAAAASLYEARVRPWAESAQKTARRNLVLFTPKTKLQLMLREQMLRLASWPPFARIVKRALNRKGERL
jgi:2-polyprenyl-6-methoxyphenol hydroxylase-like FAD-dependent oxidoreductase